jgi:hypothetical protein
MRGKAGIWMLLLGGLSLAAAAQGAGGRHEQFSRKAAKGPVLKPLCATFFGGPGAEEFVSVGVQPDGTLVAVGNTWGPDLKIEPAPFVLGKGEWYKVNEFKGGDPIFVRQTKTGVVEEAAPLDPDYPNRAGLIVRFSADARKVLDLVRFDWGVASIESALVAPDGGILIHGRATAHFEAWAKGAPSFQTAPKPDDPKAGEYSYQKLFFPGDVYVARLSPDGRKPEWVWLLKGHKELSKLFWGPEGSVVFKSFGVKRISGDGKTLTPVVFKSKVGGRFLAVNPKDGMMLFGGDHNSGTGREPWRKPYFNGYDADGNWLWSIYDWNPGLVGHDDYRLVSDSSVRVATFDHDGNVMFYGWSDGGNSVFSRHPVDLDKGPKTKHWGISLWGAGVGSFAWLTRFRVEDFEPLSNMPWCTFLMKEGKDIPNSATVYQILALKDGSWVFHGGAASFLVQTPEPWYKAAEHEGLNYTPGGRGAYIAVFSRDLDHLWFSRAIPGCEIRAMCETPQGIVIVGRSEGKNREEKPQPSPVLNAWQAEYGGGRYDAHLILLEKPPVEKAP